MISDEEATELSNTGRHELICGRCEQGSFASDVEARGWAAIHFETDEQTTLFFVCPRCHTPRYKGKP